MAALLRKPDFARHPFAQVQQKSMIVRLELRCAGRQLERKIRIVVQQFGTGVDQGFGAQGRDVIGIGLDRGSQRLHSQRKGDSALGRIGLAVEVEQVAAGDLVDNFGIARAGLS